MVTDKTRRSAFIEQNLGLVHACAGRFRGRGIEYDDLYSAGCMGLVKATDGFDEGRGVCFSTYAVPVILGEIKKLFREGGTVKVSRSLKELGLRVNAAREHHRKLCGTEPTLSQLAEELGESVENITLAIQAAQPALSLTPEGGQPTRHDLQKEGKHPAPCARFCEATAFEIEIRRLRTEAQGAAAAKAVLSQFYHASKELIDSGGSPEACRKFDDAEAKVLAIIGIVEQDTKTREDHPK